MPKFNDIIIMTVIIFFYSNLPIYMEIEKINILHMKLPYYVALFFLTVVAFFFFTKAKLSFLKNPLNIWILVYLTLILIWYLLPSNLLTEKELFIRIYNLFIMFMMTIFIYFDRTDFINVKKALFLVTIFSIGMNIYQFTNPEVFFSNNNPFGVVGRSAGLYLNPTISGMAILLGMVMTVTFVPKKYRIYYMMFGLIGILLTFSRGPLLGWGVAFMYIIFTKTVSTKNKTFAIVSLFLGVLIGLPFLIDFIQNNYDYGGDNLINRLMWFSDAQSHIAHSQQERLDVLKASWNLFADSPILGSGLGVTLHWGERASTHN
ncbi:MAG TPA: O-antigen ligase domain-containing protein, partial [Bacteroidia bacterium]|nr:O-antigen ligase domain-containing protein [Bacteroidia bacterium]